MRLILVRHGEVEAKNQVDAGLSEHGRRQAQALANEIEALSSRTAAIEAVYTSPLEATQETAATIARTTKSGPYRTHEAFGDPSGDDVEALQEQAWAAIEAMREEHSPDAVLVLVAQEMPVRMLVCSALAIPLAEMYRFRIDPGSMTALEFRSQPQRRTILTGLNETCHLGSSR